jgi:hypothetical protein
VAAGRVCGIYRENTREGFSRERLKGKLASSKQLM